jgi:hypothetical protein
MSPHGITLKGNHISFIPNKKGRGYGLPTTTPGRPSTRGRTIYLILLVPRTKTKNLVLANKDITTSF